MATRREISDAYYAGQAEALSRTSDKASLGGSEDHAKAGDVPLPYTPEWLRLWAIEAEELLEALEKYEDEHPKGAPCLIKAMDAAGAAVVEWQDRHEPTASAGSSTSLRSSDD